MHTNNLNSHHGESRNSRADKMSGQLNRISKLFIGKSKSIFKTFYKKKRRMFLKNPLFFDKI